MFKEPENGYFALALTCVVCLFVLAFVSWTIPFSKGYQRADQDHQSAYATHDAAEEHERKCSSETTVEKALRCYRNAYNADREQQRAEEDLDAQREMANWAEGMLWATVAVGAITAGVTALGVWYVARTLSATSDTLKAANEANQIMRDEQRPWIKLEREICCDLYDVGHGIRLAWNYNFTNKGRSPAYDVSLHWKAIKRDHYTGMPEEVRTYAQETLTKKDNLKGVPVVFPGETTDFLKFFSSGGSSFHPDKRNIDTGEIMILVCITYRLKIDADDFGAVGMILGFEERNDFLGPFSFKMLEYSHGRYMQ